jgi:ABC-2 type transport system permease protein
MSALSLTPVSMARLDQKLFWRNRALVAPTFLVPLALCASVPFTVPAGTSWDGVPYRGYFVTAMVAMIAVYSTFTTIAVTLTARRDTLVLKRLRGTQLSGRAILGGSVLSSYVLSGLQVALLLGVGHFALGVTWPARWWLLVVMLGYGTAVFAVLAIAYTAVIPNAESAQVLCIPVLFLCFGCSGIFLPLSAFPRWLSIIAEGLPVTALADGIRMAFFDTVGTDSLGRDLAVLGVWWAVGMISARRFFRWESTGR